MDQETISIDILSKAKVYIDKTDKLEISEIKKVSEKNWERIDKNLHSFGMESETVWLNFSLINKSQEEEFLITSEYSWIDEVNIFVFKNEILIYEERNGDKIPFNLRKIKYKLPTFQLFLKKNYR